MDQTPQVSVIIPTFNRSHYLHQAITSVLAQTYTNFEILVVDDGSTDDTFAVVARFDDPRIRYIHQENSGRSVARNLALEQARGDYIALLDDDDLYQPDKLAVQVSYLDGHQNIGLVGGGARVIDANGSLVRIRENWKEEPQLELPNCLYACPLLTCNVLFRRRWLQVLDYWFDPAMDRAEDTDFWIRLMVSGCQMDWVPHIVCTYRLHPHNSQQDDERYHRGYLMLLDKLYDREDLTRELIQEKPAIYAHYYVLGACHAYAANQIEIGQARLMQAADVAPETTKGDPPAIVSSIAGVVQSDKVSDDPAALLEIIFEDLPLELIRLKRYHGYAISTMYMQRVFAARAAHERPRFKDWLFGVFNYPQWLLNRGVWSILIRNLLMQSIPAG